MDIKHLVKKAQQGDAAAYLELFQQFEQDIYRTAYVYLHHSDDALDVVQETAYRSFKSIRNLKNPKYFKTWLISIAIKCSIDMLRRRKKVIPISMDHQPDLASGNDVDLPLSLSLQDLIDTLDEEEKSVILIRYYHDCTIKETARMLDIPLGTAKTILYRALQKLRKLSDEGDLL